MSRYAVATYFTENYRQLADLTIPTMQAYCDVHGYDLFQVCADTHSGWQKPKIVLDLLQDHGYEAVLWIDSDALVTSTHQRIEDLMLFGDFVCTADCFGLSTGTFVARSTNETAQLLYAVLSVGRALTRDHQWAEQEAIMRFARFAPYDNIVKVVPQRLMNSYRNEEYGRPPWPESNWQPGDFILHLPGMSLDDRIRIAREVLGLPQKGLVIHAR